VEMSDKLQFVAGFHHSPTAESPDKLKFVGHFLSLPAVSLGTALVVHFDTLATMERKSTASLITALMRNALFQPVGLCVGETPSVDCLGVSRPSNGQLSQPATFQ